MSPHAFHQQLLDAPLRTTVEYYAQHLNQNAHTFLRRMCLSADKTLGVGFADRTLGLQIPVKQLKLGSEIRQRLRKLGVLKPNGHETLRGFVTVPLTDISREEVTGIYGLRIDNKGKNQPQVTIGRGIFNSAALRDGREVIVCGDVLDAWTFYAAGHTHAVAVEGVEWSPQWFDAVERILFADPQPTFQGEMATIWQGSAALRIHLPTGLTVNQFAQLHRRENDCLGQRIRAATCLDPLGTAIERNSSSSPKASAASEATPAAAITTPAPAPPAPLPAQHTAEESTFSTERRRWRIRGLSENRVLGVLRVNVMIYNEANDRLHVDSFDLYHARSRQVFLRQAAEETGVVESQLRADIGRILLALEERQMQLLRASDQPATAAVELTDAQRADAMSLLQDPQLMQQILDDFQQCGLIGERIGKLTGYLVATSRLLPKPLGLVLQSSSAAGKTSLLDAVLGFMPSESLFACSALTGKSLYYAANLDLRHKILTIAEEEGVRDAAYALKLLQSDGGLSIVTTGKQSGSGRHAAERYELQGPVATLLTTTDLNVDPELLNRCLVLSVDEAHSQTAAIQQRQREAETIESLLHRTRVQQIRQRHQNAQRLLRSDLYISNPYAEQLTFPAQTVRHRRDQAKYLTLIRTIALLHQYQREIHHCSSGEQQLEYIEVTRSDIGWANELAAVAMRSSVAPELPPVTLRLLEDIGTFVSHRESCTRFTRRQIGEAFGWSTTQLRLHLDRLCQAEYVVAHGRAGRGKLVEYQLLDPDTTASLHGQLIDPATLKLSGSPSS